MRRLASVDDLVVVFRERQNGDLYRGELRLEFENDADLAFVIRLFGVGVHHHGEQRAVDADGRFDDIRVKPLVRLRIEIRQILGRIGIDPTAFDLGLFGVCLEVKILAVRDAHQLVPLFLLVLAFGEKAVHYIDRPLGIMGQFVRLLLVE